MFHTLQEYLAHTKGICYLIGAALLLLFIGFWVFLTARGDEE